MVFHSNLVHVQITCLYYTSSYGNKATFTYLLLLFYKFARCLISGMDMNFNFNSTAERDKLALAIFGSCYNDMERYIYRIYIKQ